MLRPILTNVQFHPAYAVGTDSRADFYTPTMTALDTEGRVWRTWQNSRSEWEPWEAAIEFTDPYAS
jgi:hypothetical protein